MADLGVEPAQGDLILATGGDFVWHYRWTPGGDSDPQEFPDGAQLDLLIGPAIFPFTVSGDVASVKIEHEDADEIEDRAGFRLRFTEPTTPTTETILVVGQVRRVEPR